MSEVKQYEYASREVSQRGHVEHSRCLKAGRLQHGVVLQYVRMVHLGKTSLKWEMMAQGKVQQATRCHLSKRILSHLHDAGVTHHCSATMAVSGAACSSYAGCKRAMRWLGRKSGAGCMEGRSHVWVGSMG